MPENGNLDIFFLTKIALNELIVLNKQGFLPLPDETEEDFLRRIAVLKKKKLTLYIGMVAALDRCERLFDVRPDWVEITREQKGLAPWQGAVLWIQTHENGFPVPLIQVSPRLTFSWLKRWYSEEEVIAHELVHAFRLPLASCRFEEIAAYRTSIYPLRSCLGPLIRRPCEVYIVLGAVALGWLGLLWSSLSFFIWVPWILCLLGLSRLFFSQWTFKRCHKQLACILKDPSQVLALMVRLTDQEIALFARLIPKNILSHIRQLEIKQLRWKMLCAAYLFNDQ